MGGKSGKGRVSRPHYFLGIHLGVCHGPVDSVEEIYIGEKPLGIQSSGEYTKHTVDRLDLFGGTDNEGGVRGDIHVLHGSATQQLPTSLISKLQTALPGPGFRGVLSLWFSGVGIDFRSFQWSVNSPFLKPTWVKVRHVPKGFRADLAAIGPTEANPAHIIYECWTNTDWGAGVPPSEIDMPALEYAASILFNEGLGLSGYWRGQMTVSDFVDIVLDHIQGVRYNDPVTGKLGIRLIRGDYTTGSLFRLTPDNSRVITFQRRQWTDTINEVVVTWTNPENEQEETVNAQDLGNIAIQGKTVSDSPNYFMVRSGALAMQLAQRDLFNSSSPLASAEVEVNRSAYVLKPGDVVILDSPEDGIEGMVMRVGKVDYGRPGDPTIRLPLVQDVFAQNVETYTNSNGTAWTGRGETPRAADHVTILTLPYFWASKLIPPREMDLTYPDVYAGLLVGQEGDDTQEVVYHAPIVDPAGNVRVAALGSLALAAYGKIDGALIAEPQTTGVTLTDLTIASPPAVGGFLLIGTGDETERELALISAATVDGFTLMRGVLDTVPKAWPDETPVFFIPESGGMADSQQRAAGEEVAYRVTPLTSRGILSVADAPVINTTMTERPHAPLRPAGVAVNGTSFGSVNAAGGDLTVTWATRNRQLEDTRVLAWNAAAVAPEPGQTTEVEVWNSQGVRVQNYTGLTGASHVVPRADWGIGSYGEIVVYARRNGIRSIQGHKIAVTGL